MLIVLPTPSGRPSRRVRWPLVPAERYFEGVGRQFDHPRRSGVFKNPEVGDMILAAREMK